MSLRLQLILLVTVVLAVSLGIGSVLVYGYARAKVQIEMQAAMTVGVHKARDTIEDAKTVADPDGYLRKMVAAFDGDLHLRASWVDEAGQVIAASKPLRTPDAAPKWLYRLLAGKPEVTRLALPPPLQGRGRIELEPDSHSEVAESWEEVELILATIGIFCGLVLLLTSLALGLALRPLQSLSAAFARVGGGNYGERVAETGPLELARLCRGFNRMLERLSQMEGENRRLQHQLAAVQEEERADLARDLHDEIGPLLFAVGVDAAMIKRFAESAARPEIAARSEAIREATEHMQRHIRAILGRLRQGAFTNVGLRQAVDNLVLFWRARQPDITFETRIAQEGFGRPLDEAIYRTIQEGLSNAIRHGRPRRVEIGATREGAEILVRVADDGQGFEPQAHKPGYGLAGMEERILALGGKLALCAGPDGGTVVTARLPRKWAALAPEPELATMTVPA